MNHKVFTVRYVNSKDSFCYLSAHNSNFLADGVTLKLSYGSSICYFSTQFMAGLNENEIGIDRLHGQLLDLQENDTVLCSIFSSVPGLHRIVISPTCQDDYDILEILADNIQSTLLHQIRVVNVQQNFIIWVSNSLHIIVNVDVIEPVSPGRLDNLTEVEIASPSTKHALNYIKNDQKRTNTFLNFFNRKSLDFESANLLEKYLSTTSDICFTLLPFDALNSVSVNSNFHFNVYVHREVLPHIFNSSDLCTLRFINPPQVNLLDENMGVVNKNSFVVRLIVLDTACSKNRSLPTMYVHNCLFKNFNVGTGAKALLNIMPSAKPVINKIELIVANAAKSINPSIVDRFKIYLDENCSNKPLLLNSNFIINAVDNRNCMLKFYPNTDFCLIDKNIIKNCTFDISELDLTEMQEVVRQQDKYCDTFTNVKEIVEDVLCSFKTGVMDGDAALENILITGKPGTGKTTLTKVIANQLNAHPFYIHYETISCKTLKGKSLESLHKVVSNAILNLIYYQPSVLILDDLHIICASVVEEDNLTQESLQFNRISEMMANVLDTFVTNNQIAVIATSESTTQLNQHIFSSRGLHLFKNVFNIDSLVKEARIQLLRFLIEENCESSDVDFDTLAIKTEGFVVQDVVSFVRKAMFECLKELPTTPKISMIHCERALENTVALSLQDVQLHAPGDRDFSDVGGLDDVKNILIESILWPIQFPQIFEKAPLRLQSGLLLYGPPGNGKTILVGAAAKQFHLRLISVKGPELLSKYIGASEQAVRNIFEKAQNAKPCILFFDEFDSLAPRRGHDSTGVTDRVVNQFLTQLDGVESLSGVCVLAATSRPDLLDPALLRPGRLDKQILCPLPNKESRLQILKSLSKKMTLAADINLAVIAENSKGFSGADLQAVLYTAQLSVIQEVTHKIEGEMPDTIEINQNHLDSALKSTRPSLTKQEILKYEKIYANFERGSVGADIQKGMQKATLA